MKNIKLLFACVLMVALCNTSMAQMKPKANNKSTATGGGFKRFITKTPWTFGLSGHVVDDDGNPFGNLFNVAKTWNFMPYPTRLTIDGYYQAGISFQTEFAFTKYKSGRIINNKDNNIVNTPWSSFFSTDFHVKYDLNEVIGQTNWFDPYVAGGFGFALRSGITKPFTTTYNVGLGWNIWIFENLGFNMQSMAKFSMFEGTSNYLHHSVGIIYKLEGGRGSRPGRLGKRYKFVGSKTSRR